MTTKERTTKAYKKLKESAVPDAPIDTVLLGDSWTIARTLPTNYVQCIVTSPPYFGQREYSDDEELA
jgi:DNA modification methylase